MLFDLPGPAERRRAEDLAPWIASAWGPGVAAIVETGRRLLAAKATLGGGGEFGRLFADHSDRCEGALPFGSRTGERLMAISRHRTLADPTRASSLPPRWATLAELARLPPERVEAGIAAGWVHPGMERLHATGPAPVVEAVEPRSGEEFADRVAAITRQATATLDVDGVSYLAWRLEALAAALRRVVDGGGEGPR